MSELAKIIDQSDLKFINHLIDVAEIGGLKYKRSDKKIEGFYAALRELTNSSEDVSNDELIQECLNVTAKKLGVKGIEEEKYNEKEFIERIYFRYRAKIRLELKKMSHKKRGELANKTEMLLKKEGKVLSGIGAGMLGALAAGNATGLALYTASSGGLRTLGLLLGTTFSFGTYGFFSTALRFIIGPAGFGLSLAVLAIGVTKYLFSRKESRTTLVLLTLIQVYINKQEEKYLEKERQDIESEVGSLEDISQLLDDLKKFIENKDKTVDEVKDNLWFIRIQQHMEKKNVYIS
jgi:hypothetical protein